MSPDGRTAFPSRLLTAAFACLFLAACGDNSLTSPSALATPSNHSSDLLPPPSNADQVVDLLIPFMNQAELNPCRGELVFLENQDKQNAHFAIDTSASGNLHVEIHYKNMGVKGYAMTATGGTVNYNNGEVSDWTWNVSGPPPLEETFTVNTHLIRQKEDALSPELGDDFFYHQTFHVTINAQGVPTAQVTNVSADCR